MRKIYAAQLDIDDDRGVIYVHLTNPDDITALGMVTPIRLKVMEFFPNHLLPIDGILLKPSYSQTVLQGPDTTQRINADVALEL